ncbi:MAG: cupin domain-containing protein [Candidatus Glassbacteria bacterium]|nr:cupin domain-containing protein [Candidatus Glassbacteria bacterium]
MSQTAEEVIELLGLVPLEIEGGWYREVWRSRHVAGAETLGKPFSSVRSLATSIYYLLTPETVSAIHRLSSDEIFHFYFGDPVRMLQLYPDNKAKIMDLGTDLAAGQRPQVVVPGGTWQGCLLIDGGRFALMGTTVSPGFEFEDFVRGSRGHLLASYPEHAGLIERLTPDEA